MLIRESLQPRADAVELVNFVQDRFKRHGDSALWKKPKEWKCFRWTGLGQKT